MPCSFLVSDNRQSPGPSDYHGKHYDIIVHKCLISSPVIFLLTLAQTRRRDQSRTAAPRFPITART